MRKNRIKITGLLYILLSLLSVFTLLIVDATSVLSYFYLCGLFLVFNKLITGKWLNRNFIYLHYYAGVAIFLFVFHRYMIPSYLGMTGPENGIGTDDCRFYAQLVEGRVSYAILFDLYRTFNFVKFLQVLYPFEVYTPLNIIIPNLLGIIFLPHYVNRLSLQFTDSTATPLMAERLFLLCPFTTYYGCILMRDMWIATFVFAGLYYFIQKRYLAFAICTALIVYIRFGSIVFLGAGVLIIMREQLYAHFSTRVKGRMVLLIILGIVMALFMVTFPYIQKLSGGKLEDGLFRASFFTKLERMDSDAFLLRLMQLPFPLSLLSLTAFFFFLPFLSLTFHTFGIFNMNRLFCAFLTPLMFLFLWKAIIQTVLQNLSLKQYRPVKTVVYMAIVYAMCLGSISLQARHKTILFPLLCILAAYGLGNVDKKYAKWSYLTTIFLIGIQLYMAL